MNNYETVFIVTPVLSDAQVQEVADKFQGVITENGGQIVNKESWGLRKLAYPIQKKTTGFYFLVEFTGEGSLVNTLETQYRRDERVIRFLTFKQDHGTGQQSTVGNPLTESRIGRRQEEKVLPFQEARHQVRRL